jgi:hypothetical protein
LEEFIINKYGDSQCCQGTVGGCRSNWPVLNTFNKPVYLTSLIDLKNLRYENLEEWSTSRESNSNISSQPDRIS